MGQVTIYLEDELEKQMILAAKKSQLSKSKWISTLIKTKISNEWPDNIQSLSGAWLDFPEITNIRSNENNASKREDF